MCGRRSMESSRLTFKRDARRVLRRCGRTSCIPQLLVVSNVAQQRRGETSVVEAVCVLGPPLVGFGSSGRGNGDALDSRQLPLSSATETVSPHDLLVNLVVVGKAEEVSHKRSVTQVKTLRHCHRIRGSVLLEALLVETKDSAGRVIVVHDPRV